MGVVRSTVKGQILIPAPLRKKFKIVQGTLLNVYEEEHRIVVEPLHEDPVSTGRGMLKTGGRVLRSLLKDRKREARQ
jgi:AbrB family looped-hinge helix DNA binding protein